MLLIFFRRVLLSGSDGEMVIFIHFESHRDLGHCSRDRLNSDQVKLAKKVVVLGEGHLTLVHSNADLGLPVVVHGHKDALLGGQDCASLNHGSEETSTGLNAKGQTSYFGG